MVRIPPAFVALLLGLCDHIPDGSRQIHVCEAMGLRFKDWRPCKGM